MRRIPFVRLYCYFIKSPYTQLEENYKRVTESQKGGAANRLHLLQRRVYLGCEVDYTAYFLFKSQK